MNLSPAPFLRIGFAILGLGLALGIWSDASPTLGWWALPAGMLGFLAVTRLGEMIFRRVATAAEVRADLAERTRNMD